MNSVFKYVIGGLVAFILAIIIVVSCGSYVDTGRVGVVYSMKHGVEDETLSQGFHLLSPMKKVKEFSVSNEQFIMSKDKQEGSDDDESFEISTADGSKLRISFQMSYRFIEDNVVDTYKKFKGMDGQDIVDQRIKTVLKSQVSEVTCKYSIMQLYSSGRAEINKELSEYLNKNFQDTYGIEVLGASIIDVHPNKDLKKSINEKVKAKQQAETAKAEAEAARAKAETAKIKAQNKADIKVIEAEAEAKETMVKAEAEAKANEKIAKSLTDNVVKKMWIEKWNGGLPKVSGAKNTLFNLNDILK